MLIIGHELLKDFDFSFVKDLKEINKIEDRKIYCIYYDEKLIFDLKIKNAKFAILIQNKDEIFLANALGASFLIFNNKKLAKLASKIAEFYIFDSKILMLVDKLEKFKKFYKIKVDGVILRNAIYNLKN